MNRWRCLVAAVMGLCCGMPVGAYLVAYPPSLDQMNEQAAVIVKATVLGRAPAQDPWFKGVQGFAVYATRLRVVSVCKGQVAAKEIVFRHYGEAEQGVRHPMYMPQWYRFTTGRTYLIWAAATDTPNVFRQLWANHTTKVDLGVLLAADDQPVAGNDVKAIMWDELGKLLASATPADVVYAIAQLRDFSGGNAGGFDGVPAFEREKVLDRMSKVVASKNPEIAEPAITAIGLGSPYLDENAVILWLATLGRGEIRGIGKFEPVPQNLGARKYWRELVAAADGEGPLRLRALAARALGRAQVADVEAVAVRWAAAPEPELRAAGTLLLGEYPAGKRLLGALAKDPTPSVRVAVAQTIGLNQLVDSFPVLESLLADPEADVRIVAAMNLTSFAPEQAEKLLLAQVDNPEFRPVFANLLASRRPEPYLDRLAAAIVERQLPPNFWGGQTPAFTSWEILLGYLGQRTPAELQGGKLDRLFDALEKAEFVESSHPRDLYAFYRKQGWNERAARFRAACGRTIKFGMNYYFNEVDQGYGGQPPK